MTLKIEEMFAFIAEETDGEGLTGFHSRAGWVPMVGADMARVDSMREIAREIANATGRKITLCRFSVREEMEVITPKNGQH